MLRPRSFDVDDPFPTIDLGDLALAILESSFDNEDHIGLANGDEADVVLVTKVDGERGDHQNATDAERGGEVSLTRFTAKARNPMLELHGGGQEGGLISVREEEGELKTLGLNFMAAGKEEDYSGDDQCEGRGG